MWAPCRSCREYSRWARCPAFPSSPRGSGNGKGGGGVLAMGAAGAWVGTRFCATIESTGTEGAKQCILQSDETQTIHTHVFDIVQDFPWPEEFPGRAISNAFSERWHGREEELLAGLATIRGDFEEAQRNGDYSKANVYAGRRSGCWWDLPRRQSWSGDSLWRRRHA